MSAQPSSGGRHPEPDYVIVADSHEEATKSLAEVKSQLASAGLPTNALDNLRESGSVVTIIGSLGDIMGDTYLSAIQDIVQRSADEALVQDWKRVGGDLQRALARAIPDERAERDQR